MSILIPIWERQKTKITLAQPLLYSTKIIILFFLFLLVVFLLRFTATTG